MSRIARSVTRLSRIAYGAGLENKTLGNLPLGKLLLMGEGVLIVNELFESLSGKNRNSVASLALYFAMGYVGYKLYQQYVQNKVQPNNTLESLAEGIQDYKTNDQRKMMIDNYLQGLSRMRKENPRLYYEYLANFRRLVS